MRFFGFGVRFGLRIFRFLSIRFSVFVENNSGFFGFIIQCGFWVFLF